MSRPIIVVDANGERTIAADRLPLIIGSRPDADIRVPGSVADAARAQIDVLDERPFLQAVGRDGVEINDEPVSANRWLEEGDIITIAGVRIVCEFSDAAMRLAVDEAAVEYPTLPPESVDAVAEIPEPITPVRPRPRPSPPAKRQSAQRLRWAGGGLLALLLAVAAWLFTAEAVRIEAIPAGAQVRVTGGWMTPKIGGRYLLHAGTYRVALSADGYRPKQGEIVVRDVPNQAFAFELDKLPGRLAVATDPPVDARLYLDGAAQPVALPGEPVTLEAGPHDLRIEADRYQPFDAVVDVEGRDVRQPFLARLEPGWGDVTVRSQPAGADIFIDDEPLATTPATVAVMAGTHELAVRKDGYKAWTRELAVSAGEPLTLDTVELSEADGLLTVLTTPRGAAVSVDGRFRGNAPVEVELAPGRRYEVIASKPGFGTLSREVELASRAGRTLRLTLEPRVGILRVQTEPDGAELFVDGQSRGAASQALELPSRPHRIEVRKPGFVPFTTEISPQPGFPEVLNVRLLTPEEAVLAAIPATLTTGDGTTLVLVRPGGEFEMGAPRREQGRRPNEAQHRVRLTRPYYIAATEVTNRQFQAFKPKHTSGAEKYRQLAIGNHPAVMMSWEEATGYCNWLSAQDDLPPAYVFANGDIVLADPPTIGYRLPTEAEWAWAARFNGGGGARKYPWGDHMPPPAGSGNFADKAARAVAPTVLSTYNDRYATTAPVGSFAPSPLGLFDLGGNVAEWVNDRYSVYTRPGGVPDDPVGPGEGQYHVIRGSGWRHSSISELRYAYRDFGDRGRLDVGFRIARYADAPEE